MRRPRQSRCPCQSSRWRCRSHRAAARSAESRRGEWRPRTAARPPSRQQCRCRRHSASECRLRVVGRDRRGGTWATMWLPISCCCTRHHSSATVAWQPTALPARHRTSTLSAAGAPLAGLPSKHAAGRRVALLLQRLLLHLVTVLALGGLTRGLACGSAAAARGVARRPGGVDPVGRGACGAPARVGVGIGYGGVRRVWGGHV